jgi:glycosyltransferase involved in cell wall biosynthesis
MKHVLIVNHNAGSVHHGPNFRSYYVARSLIPLGVRVTIVCSSFSHKLKKFPVVKGAFAEDDVDGVRMIWLKTPAYHSSPQRFWNYCCFARRLPLLYDLVSEPVDVVVCSSPPPYWIWFCRKFARDKGARLIFECRDLWPDVILETKRTAFVNPAVWLMMAAERVAYRSCDAVVAVNSEVRATMEARGLASNKFHTIQNGVVLNANEKHAELSSAIKKRFPRNGFFRVGYAGSLSRVYGLEHLIEAARLLRHEQIIFVLAGGGGHERFLYKQAADLPNVYFVGWVPKPELCAFLRQMNITYAGLLDLPSFNIGSDSTKIFEYMKAERPVVHAHGAKTSVIRKAGCGIHVPPENPKAIADAVLRLRSISEGERRKMEKKGLEYLEKHRTYNVLAGKWMELLNS